MWTRPPPSSGIPNSEFARPATASEGAFVPQLWARVAQADPRDRTDRNALRGRDDTVMSEGAPAWMNATNRFAPAENAPWDWITTPVSIHLRRAVQDDTENSHDAPEWFRQELKAPQPQATARFDTFRLGAHKRVMLKPLVEADPYGLLSGPRALPPLQTRAGFFPTLAERQRGLLAPGERPPRLGATESSAFGAGDFDAARKAERAAPRERLGRTAAAVYGRGELGATPQLAEPSMLPAEGSLHSTGARFRNEPPSLDYFRGVESRLPDGTCLVRPQVRTDATGAPHGHKVGHSLFFAMVADNGARPAQHLAESVQRLQRQGAGALLRSAPAGMFGASAIRQPPLSYYNVVR